jgi:hypothetical protein
MTRSHACLLAAISLLSSTALLTGPAIANGLMLTPQAPTTKLQHFPGDQGPNLPYVHEHPGACPQCGYKYIDMNEVVNPGYNHHKLRPLPGYTGQPDGYYYNPIVINPLNGILIPQLRY